MMEGENPWQVNAAIQGCLKANRGGYENNAVREVVSVWKACQAQDSNIRVTGPVSASAGAPPTCVYRTKNP